MLFDFHASRLSCTADRHIISNLVVFVVVKISCQLFLLFVVCVAFQPFVVLLGGRFRTVFLFERQTARIETLHNRTSITLIRGDVAHGTIEESIAKH